MIAMTFADGVSIFAGAFFIVVFVATLVAAISWCLQQEPEGTDDSDDDA